MSLAQRAKSLAKATLAQTLSLSGLAQISARLGKQNWSILMYHRIIDPCEHGLTLEPGMYVKPETFEMHAEYFSKSYDVIELDALVDEVLAGKTFKRPTLALTFDDGWKDNYDNAFPILKKFSLPATIFLPTAFIGSERYHNTNAFAPIGAEAQKTGEFLSWEEIKEMSKSKISFGSHSHTHPTMTSAKANKIAEEVETSVKIINDEISSYSKVFCYPRGAFNAQSQEALAKSSVSAALGVSRQHQLTSSPPLFGRIGIHQDISHSKALLDCRINVPALF